MKNQSKNLLIAIALIAFGVLFRVLHLIPNFSPIAAIALFAGARISNKKLAVVIPLVAMLLGDLLLSKITGYPFLHDTLVFVYASFILIAFLGFTLKNSNSPVRIFGMAVSSSLLFFILTNFGVWLAGNLYPQTLEGLLTCYIKAIPYYQWTFISDVIFTAVLFSLYSILVRKTDVLFQTA